MKDWRITYPVVADNEYAIWNAFGNQYWPAHYISTLADSCVIPHSAKGLCPPGQVIQQLLRESKA